MNKFKIAFIVAILCIIIAGMSCGAAYATWVYDDTLNTSNSIGFTVPTWDFEEDSDFALIGNVDQDNLLYFNATQETGTLCGSAEAVRLTNTYDLDNKTRDHSVIFRFDRPYTIGELKTKKITFDYYYAQRREQADKGFPRLQLVNGTSGVGNTQPTSDTVCNEISCFSVTPLNNGWWHLEYFINALTPTYADHGDTLPYNESKTVDGVKILDRYIINHDSIAAYCIIDNLQISSAASIKLGLFNRGNSFDAGKYYWMKVAWAGEVHSVTITFSDDGSDDPVCVYTPSAKSPFYIKGLRAGTVVATCTMELGDEHQILSISNTIIVT